MIPMTVPAKAGHQYLTERCVYSRCVGDRSDDTLCEATMYKNILLTIDLNDETSYRKPLLSAIELARAFGARLQVLTGVRRLGNVQSGDRQQGCVAAMSSHFGSRTLRQLKPDWPTGLLLPHCGAIDRISARCDVTPLTGRRPKTLNTKTRSLNRD